MSGHNIPSPVDLAVQETAAAYAEELRAHVALARAWGKATDEQHAAHRRAKANYEAVRQRLRRTLDEERA